MIMILVLVSIVGCSCACGVLLYIGFIYASGPVHDPNSEKSKIK